MNKAHLLAAVAMVGSISAHAQLKSADHGAAVTDSNGLMWANTVGTLLSWSPTGEAGSAQAWVAGLNASDYGGFNDWTLATGDGSVAANTKTNQLGELFYTDCGNSVGTPTVLTNPGKNCKALSAVKSLIDTPSIFFSASPDPALNTPFDSFFWAYQTASSVQVPWTNDTVFSGGGLPVVGLGDALAVRAAPEIDPSSMATGLALLFGCLAVLRGRRTRAATPGCYAEQPMTACVTRELT
jgi:hypothetical protein